METATLILAAYFVAGMPAQARADSVVSTDAVVWADQLTAKTTVATPAFSTRSTNELLLAFISAGNRSGTTSVSSVSGAGLTWQRVVRTNAQRGTAEIWRAFAAAPLSNAVVTARLSQSVTSSMTIVSFIGVDTSGTNGSGAIGATRSASAASGAPTASLTTTRANSWVFAVGTDWTAATARTLGTTPPQTLIHQALATAATDTYWVQGTTAPTALGGTSVTINDTAPTADRWNLSLCEVRPALATDTTPPTVTMAFPADGTTVSGTISPTATASDNVGVVGVQFKLDGVSLGAEDTGSPYTVAWDTTTGSSGAHALTAVARDAAGNTMTATAVTVTVNNDTIPPTVTGTAPPNGATNVASTAVAAVTFSKALDATTVSTTTVRLADSSGTSVAATVTYSSGTATLTPAAPLANSTTYTATVKGGTSGVKDAAGNALAADFVWTFTTTASSTGSYSLWTLTTTPGAMDADASPVELGVKFTADSAGYITGLRFYKYAQNTGTHVGTLWTTSGASLGTVTFANETASGWQEASFATPVAIAANTTYVASYHTNTGYYSATNAGLTTAVDTPPLHALASATAGGNGVYVYGATSAFPTETYQATNYWVDVVFSTTVEPDTTPAAVTAFTIPATATSLTVAITAFTATDNVAVTGYLVSESSVAPAPTETGWSATAQTAYTFTTAGAKTLYAWAKDGAGNVSASRSANVTITLSTDITPPTVTAFTLPAASTTLTAPITSLTATDNVGVTGYLVNESSAVPAPTVTGWSATAQTSYTFTSAGAKTLYAWAKDAAGNVSASRSANVTVTLSVVLEPAGWYAGDPHVHRSCGSSPEAISSLFNKMSTNDLAVISLLADMGNGEVQNATQDLPRVNGSDDPVSTAGRCVHWDAEWHWDATYGQYGHQALGGHIVALGLSAAHQIWEEYTYPILDWAHKQGGIAGFVHMQYLDDGIPTSLTCCTPIEYPVEVALGAADFISEDVTGGESAINAYYRLLNTGFRPALTAGTDYPCGVSVLGSLLTYAQVAGGQMTYRNWIDGIAARRTVVSRNGHNEFVQLTVNGSAGPGDEVALVGGGNVPVTIQWTSKQSLSGRIELVKNGAVVAQWNTSAAPGAPATVSTTVNFTRSGWLAARRMDSGGHVVHTGAVFVTVDGAPVRASAADAQFYVAWMDNLLAKTSPGGEWNGYFPTSLAQAQARYNAARAIFQQIALEAAAGNDVTAPTVAMTAPAGGVTVAGATVAVSATASDSVGVVGVQFKLDGVNLGVEDTSSPYGVVWNTTTATNGSHTLTAVARDAAGNTATAAPGVTVTVNNSDDTTPPTVAMTAPLNGATLTGSAVTLSATASDNVGVVGVHFLLDGSPLGSEVASAPYSLSWNTLSASNGVHSLAARARDAAGNQTTSPSVSVVVSNGTSPLLIDATAFGDRSSMATTVTTSTFSTTAGNELLLAFVASDGSMSGSKVTVTGVAGAGLTWQLVVRTNVQLGTAEVWRAFAPAVLTNVSVTATLSQSVAASVTAVSFLGADGSGTNGSGAIGATGTANANPGAPTASLTTTRDNSWVFGVGNDWDNGIARTPGSSQTVVHQYLATVGDTFWVQRRNATTPSSGTSVTINDSAPSGDRYNLSLVEILPAIVSGATPPTVTATAPTNGAIGVSTAAVVSAIFSQAMDPSTINASTIALRDASNAIVASMVTYDAANRAALVTPSASLVNASTYAVTVGTGVKNAAGTPLASAVSWSFTTTVPVISPSQGAGGPILVVANSTNPFGQYYAEILRAEGLNEFAVVDASQVTASLLSAYDVVILGEQALTTTQVTLLTNWVQNGGNLIAMRPDSKLASLLGLTSQGATLANGYLLINTTVPPGAGLVSETIQFHGTADQYLAAQATTVADLYATATQSTPYPAVTLNTVGANGGHAAAFTYDLARSVVYTRQGNPAWAGQERDGQAPIRPDDLFFGGDSSDWVDLNKVAIPQADEQQRLLANLIILMNSDRKPLPRLWYFPRGVQAAVVMTGDDHGNGGTAGRFTQYVALGLSGCSVDNWECVRGTSYMYPATQVTDSQLASFVAQGFEIGGHVTMDPGTMYGCGVDFTPATLSTAYSTQLAQFAAKWPSVPRQVTHRMHCIMWSDWVSQAQTELLNGIRFDTSYYYWPSSWIQDRPGLFTGSGMPMRFAALDGAMIDVYQSPTQLTDESGQTYPLHIDTLLDNALGASGYYGAFTANMHNDSSSSAGSDAIVSAALSRGVPVVSARQMLTWIDGRNNSVFGPIAWAANTLTFSIAAASGANGLQLMVPVQAGALRLTGITLNGAAVTTTTRTVKGLQYAFVTVGSGQYRATYAP